MAEFGIFKDSRYLATWQLSNLALFPKYFTVCKCRGRTIASPFEFAAVARCCWFRFNWSGVGDRDQTEGVGDGRQLQMIAAHAVNMFSF